MLPQLDFSTIKNELFPVIAAIFSKTNSLAIKVRGLQAFVTLCGGSNDPGGDDGLDGFAPQKKATSSTALDKFTMQEKIVPLIKAIKTKEPAVMMAALNVLQVVGKVADADFVAMDILPILWSMSLGPLLDLKQFQAFIELIKTLSSRVEEEQTKKLQELSGGNANSSGLKDDFMSFGPVAGLSLDANGTTETDFESLVKGDSIGVSANPLDSGWDSMAGATTATSPITSSRKSTPTATFSWSTAPAAPAAGPANTFGAAKVQQPGFRTVTPDLANFKPITPTATQFSQPLQPAPKTGVTSPTPLASQPASINWGAAPSSTNTSNLWSSQPATQQPPTSAFGSLSLGQQQQQPQNRAPTFSLPPPPGGGTGSSTSAFSGFSLAPPPGASQPQTQAPRPQITSTTSTPAFSGLGGMNSMNSLASLGTAAAANSPGMSMGVGMAAMKNMNTGMGNGTSMNSMMGMGIGGMAMGQQQQQQQNQGQGQGQKLGLDKYESLL